MKNIPGYLTAMKVIARHAVDEADFCRLSDRATDFELLRVPNMGRNLIAALTEGRRRDGGRLVIVSHHVEAQIFCCDAMGVDYGLATTLDHLSASEEAMLLRGDTLAGVIPIQIVARLSKRGVRCMVLIIDTLPDTLRGKELSGAEMVASGAELIEYLARNVTRKDIENGQ